MKVKPLKWTEEEYGWRATTPWGPYMVETAEWPGAEGAWYATFHSGELDDVYFDTADAAKAACEADWDRRVKECCE